MIAVLHPGLQSLLGADAVIVACQRNAYTSTCPSEIVTCRFEDGREARVLCKYAAAESHKAFGHRGGVGYEALVYREVVARSGLSAPRFFGELGDDRPGLVIEFVDDAQCAEEAVPAAEAMYIAARWCGQFHARNEATAPQLNRYDPAYYGFWPRRTLELAVRWQLRLPWLAALCTRTER